MKDEGTEGSIQLGDFDESTVNSITSSARKVSEQFNLPSGLEIEKPKKIQYKLPLIAMGISRVEVKNTMDTIQEHVLKQPSIESLNTRIDNLDKKYRRDFNKS